MASPVTDAIGLISGALGIVSFFQSNIPPKPETPEEGAIIKIKAALPDDNDPGFGGHIFKAYAWDTKNNYLGEGDGDDIKPGGLVTTVIDSYSNGARTEYTGISVDDDAVCVIWITVSQFDQTRGAAWTGDVGYDCGQYWYENQETAGFLDDVTKERYIPKCTWLDADHTGGTPSASMKFLTTGYGDNITDTADNSKACSLTLWGKDKAPINGQPSKRENRPRLPWMERRLVISNITQHKAKDMCASATSWGPDFVSPDGMFCDMETKTLTSLCSVHNIDGCLDIDDNRKMITKRSFIGKRAVDDPHKTYTSIRHWE